MTTRKEKVLGVSTAHPLGIFKAEHQIILKNLEELDWLAREIGKEKGFEEIKPQLKRLREISALLLETESHHQREEQVLFPRLEKHDVTGPPQVMVAEHVELRKTKKLLAQLVKSAGSIDYSEFVKGVQEAGFYLADNLKAHIFKEDNILYPAALSVLDESEWEEVKREFDRLGYRSFTPGKN